MTEERFSFTSKAKKTLVIIAIVGVVLLGLGVILTMSGDHGHEAEGHAINTVTEHSMLASADEQEQGTAVSEEGHGEAEGHHGSPVWLKRLFSNLWINNVYFTGLAIIGVFFIAIQYAAQAGWSAGMKRIPLAMAHWLPIAGVLMVISWFVVKFDVFHWTHESLYAEVGGDEIIKGKAGLWYWPLESGTFPLFYILRMVIFFALWYMFFIWIKREMLEEDIDGNVKHWYKARKYSAIFLVVFAVTSSIAAWDWVMSIDPHWFSTMFGWYMFASWWVNGLAAITFIVVMLKQNGYLKVVNANHLHDIGKFIFGFSIFWTYIWFSQFLLIYYANIPEETVYFIQRIETSQYKWVFFLNLILNFFLPFLLLMTRDAKRHMALLKVVCPIVIVGHWFDFYLMVTPGVMQFDGGFGFIEIGMAMIFLAAFVWVTLVSLTKAPLYAKNHPMLQESLHHHI
ncbi:quinol:cytochrome C oxidoreductase [Fulvivirga sp. RKSG066]|uniref:quinol:cytochrome C oxidoreductase n=1 Tax=Fulvivirga aurantia TaxID=2529383 RepID=UPI0012BBD163|nr:quinol:cytochrome C oxidoreductase [Fulvivirga aurantia]MTI22836.1 quinol:cytochrome C oxidoreductase [Fulvivirga aurantia]